MPVLLGVTKFATSMKHPGCEGNCTSVFLPGGVESSRQTGTRLNSSLLKGGVLNQGGAIRIKDAQGFLLEFRRPDPTFDFDRNVECVTYGEENRDAIQICARDVDDSIVVGTAHTIRPSPQLNNADAFKVGRRVPSTSIRLGAASMIRIGKPRRCGRSSR